MPKECRSDCEKTVVLRWEAGKPVFNPAFTAFLTHYQCKPVACRPGRPETKGKIEAPFTYIEGNLLGGRAFADLDDLRATARWWLTEKADRHVHRTTGKPPGERCAEEALQPLPRHPSETAEVALRLCDTEGFVAFETNRYSVPSGSIADILSLKATEEEILIYSPEIDCIARHGRELAGAGKKVEDPAHVLPKRDRYGLEPVRAAFLALGGAAEAFLQGLTGKPPRNAGFHARLILRLKAHDESGDIERALAHALRYHAFDGQAVERILQGTAQPRTLESVRNEHARQHLAEALPRIAQRPLQDYSALLEGTDEDEADPGRDPAADPGAPEDPQAGGDPAGP